MSADGGAGGSGRGKRSTTSLKKLFGPHTDEADLRSSRVLPLIEKRLQQLDGGSGQRRLARHGLPRRVRAGHRAKMREAHGDGDGAEGAEALASHPREDLAGQRPHALRDEGGVERVHLEGLLLADRFRLPLVGDRAVRESARLGVEILAPAAEPFGELVTLERAEVANGANAPPIELGLRLRADAGDDANAQRVEE